MQVLIFIFAAFAVLGILDLITGNHAGLGTEFERGIQLIGPLTLAMLGMLCLVPVISSLLEPVILPLANALHLDPSVFSAMLIANDMGGAPLSAGLAADEQMGAYNGLVVSSMMGVTVSFTIPTALKMIPEAHQKDAMLGILCGVCTIPVGCMVGGAAAGISLLKTLVNCIPIALFAALIAFGLFKAPERSVRLLTLFGKGISALIMVGLGLGIFRFLTGITLISSLAPVEDSFELLFNLAFLLSGVFPLIRVLSALLKKPLARLSGKIGINETAALGLLTTLASSAPTFGLVKDMNRRGVILNMAFAVSAAFTVGDHLAFTVMYNADYALPMIASKLAAGFTALLAAHWVSKNRTAQETSVQTDALPD